MHDCRSARPSVSHAPDLGVRAFSPHWPRSRHEIPAGGSVRLSCGPGIGGAYGRCFGPILPLHPELLLGSGPVPLGAPFGSPLSLPDGVGPKAHLALPFHVYIRVHVVTPQAAFLVCSLAAGAADRTIAPKQPPARAPWATVPKGKRPTVVRRPFGFSGRRGLALGAEGDAYAPRTPRAGELA